MATQGDESKVELEFTDDVNVPEIFADELRGFALLNGTVSLTFEALRWHHAADAPMPKRATVLRLRMSVTGAQNLAVGLFDFLAKRGLDPARKPPDEPVQ